MDFFFFKKRTQLFCKTAILRRQSSTDFGAKPTYVSLSFVDPKLFATAWLVIWSGGLCCTGFPWFHSRHKHFHLPRAQLSFSSLNLVHHDQSSKEVEQRICSEEIICFKYNIPDLKQDHHLVVAGATISQFS